MMKILIALLLSVSVLAGTPSQDYQHFDALKIGDKAYPIGSSLVEMKSTTQGLLIPRMTTTQRLAIASPVDGLLVYDTNLKTVVEYNATLAAWTFLVASGGGAVLNPSVAVQTDSSGNLLSSSVTSTQLGYLSPLVAAGGDIVYTSGTGMLGLAAGNSGYLLQSNGSSAPSWVNSYSGNAATATTAINGVNIQTGQQVQNGTYYPLFVGSASNIEQPVNIATNFSINPSTDVVTATGFTATTFTGALTGNASTATTATNSTNIATTQTTTSANYYPLLAPATANGNQSANLMTGFSFNPGLDTLTTGNYVTAFSTGVAAGGTFTLTNASPGQDIITGSTTQTIKLPVTSTLNLGQSYFIVNNSTGVVTVQSSGGNTIQALAASSFATFTCISQVGTSNTSWSVEYTAPAGTPTFSGLTQWGAMYANSTTSIASTAAPTQGSDVLTSTSASAAPIWQVPATGQYAQAYFGSASSWSTTSSTFADPTNSGGNSLTVRQHSGITLTAASSNLPGITFTPASSSAVYLITATMSLFNGTVSDVSNAQLTDGTTVIVVGPGYAQGATSPFDSDPTTIIGIYAPGTTSAVTVKVQLLAGGGTASIGNYTSSSSTLEWTVVRIF